MHINKLSIHLLICLMLLMLSLKLEYFLINQIKKFEFKSLPYCLQMHVSLYHKAYIMRMLWRIVKNGTIKAMHNRNALRLTQRKCGFNLWKHTHCEASIKDFLIGIYLPNFVINIIMEHFIFYRHKDHVVPQNVVPTKIMKSNVAHFAGVF